MAIKLIGAVSGVESEVDSNRNQMISAGLPAHPAAGGFYIATGGPAGIVAAGLATDVSLMAMRFAPASTRKAYIDKFELILGIATVGLSGGVGGVIGLQRFSGATPTGGVARIPSEMNDPLTTLTDMTSIQDSAAALGVVSVVFGTEVAWFRQNISTVGSVSIFTFEPTAGAGYPLVLQPGDGLVLRTRVALGAVQTSVFSWRCIWHEA